MFKKENRLTKNNDFDNVWKKGRSSFDKILGVKMFKNGLDINRFGTIVSTKVSKKAVDRNRVKRRIRSVIENEFDQLNQGFDIVINSLPAIKEKTFKEIEVVLIKNLKKLKLYK